MNMFGEQDSDSQWTRALTSSKHFFLASADDQNNLITLFFQSLERLTPNHAGAQQTSINNHQKRHFKIHLTRSDTNAVRTGLSPALNFAIVHIDSAFCLHVHVCVHKYIYVHIPTFTYMYLSP